MRGSGCSFLFEKPSVRPRAFGNLGELVVVRPRSAFRVQTIYYSLFELSFKDLVKARVQPGVLLVLSFY
eukprot:scaffold25008_cov31-Tisochrysis_lutea.AAC.3